MATSAVPTADTATTTKFQEFIGLAKQVLDEVFAANPALSDTRAGHAVIAHELARHDHQYRVYQISEFLNLAIRFNLVRRSGGWLMPGPKLTDSPTGSELRRVVIGEEPKPAQPSRPGMIAPGRRGLNRNRRKRLH